ncbi:MAG TPA: hypothetical protein VF713_19385 [Thermoanaerobaculia bacterium]
MPEATLSVKDLLGLPEGGFPAELLRAGISDQEVNDFKTKVTGALHGMQMSDLEAAVSSKLSEVLDVDPVTLFAGAWEKYHLLSDAAKQSKSGETVLVPLEEHAVKSKLHPYIEIQLGPDVLRRIEFEVALSLKLKGIVVRVQSGEIRGIEAGTCEGSAEISVAESSIWKHDIKPIELPGKITLHEGIPIH